MEQKDYLLREIEKIGLLLRMIINKIISSDENFAIAQEQQFEKEKELLLNEIGFDMEFFLSLESTDIEKYLSKFDGIRGPNIELTADILREMGMKTDGDIARKYFSKALKLYELCNSLDKTFSFARENKISEVKDAL